MKELIHGSYMEDENFITVFTDDTMYQIAQNSGEWAYRKVGSVLANGVRLTKDLFDSWKEECEMKGTFVLK